LDFSTSLNPSKGGKPHYNFPPLEGLREVKTAYIVIYNNLSKYTILSSIIKIIAKCSE